MTTLAIPAARPSPLAVFRKRSFTLLWIGQLVTEMGTALTSLAASIYIYQLTGSALHVGLMMMAAAAPTLLVGLVAGVFVDRYDRKRIMIAAEVIRFVLIGSLPLLMPHGVGWLYIMVALSGAVGQFFNPAHAAVLPEIASEEELNAANAMMAISSFGSLALGFALAGIITANFPIEWAFYIDALTFLASATCIELATLPSVTTTEKTTIGNVVSSLKTGLVTIRQTPILRSLFMLFLFMFLNFGFMNAIRLPFAIESLGATEFEFSLFESVTIVGLVIASLLMARLGDRLREGQWLAISFIGMGITGVLVGVATGVSFVIMVMFFEGFLNAPSIIARSLVIQRNVPRETRGRVFGAFFVMRDTAFMVGMALAGLADLLDVRLLYLAGGVMALGLGVWTLVLPGLGQPSAEWRRSISLLRTAPDTSGLGSGRVLMPADWERLTAVSSVAASLPRDRQNKLRRAMTLHEVPRGTWVIRRDEPSEAAYFILEGRAVAGRGHDDTSQVLEVLHPGDFFGEIGALTGMVRTAHVITQLPTVLIRVPAAALREMTAEPSINRVLMSRMTERMMRMNMLDSARLGRLDQDVMREIRSTGEMQAVL